MNKNYYDILGVQRNASDDDIKKAYKKAAIKWHPDRWANKSEAEKKNAEEKFKEINEANDCLSDPDKRRHYDSFGTMEGFGQGGFPGGGFEFNMGDMFGDMFNMFGGNRNRNQVVKGQTVQINVSLTIEEILCGVHKDISYNIFERCDECNGEGGTGIEKCPHCHGTGMITETQHTPFGIIQNSHPCQYCGGKGKKVKHHCPKCKGRGLIEKNKVVHINQGPGLTHGERIQYNGMGYQPKESNGINGDLIVTFVHQYDQSKYRIQGNIIYELVEIDYYDCILGTTFEHTLPNNKKVNVIVNECSAEGTQIVLRNEGINRNNYIIVVKVKMPTKLNNEQRELLKQIKNA